MPEAGVKLGIGKFVPAVKENLKIRIGDWS
jgi:hypothetical protein